VIGIGICKEMREVSLLVDAGRHRLEIVRPGYESLRKEFTAAPGEAVVLDLQLEEE